MHSVTFKYAKGDVCFEVEAGVSFNQDGTFELEELRITSQDNLLDVLKDALIHEIERNVGEHIPDGTP